METRRILKKFDLSVPWVTAWFICPMSYGLIYLSHELRLDLSVPWVTAWFICPMSYGLIYLSHELRLLIITLVFSTMADRFTENCD
jgi:hypothetical protein